MPDVDGVLEIEVIDQLGEIVGVMVHVVAVPRLTGTAMAAAVMTDAALPPPVFNPSTPNTVPNPPPVPVPPVRAAPGGVSSPGRLAPGRAGALPDAEPCSVFDEEPCFPPILPPIGQDLRLTIVSTDDESSAKPPDADSTKHGNDADATGDKQHDAKSLDSIAEMYAALRAAVHHSCRHGGRRRRSPDHRALRRSTNARQIDRPGQIGTMTMLKGRIKF
jgi:hypothetical protein